MTRTSTTIRVSTEQRERLRHLAEARAASMADTLDAALESLRRQQFYESMASAQARLQQNPVEWNAYVKDRDEWLNTDLGSS